MNEGTFEMQNQMVQAAIDFESRPVQPRRPTDDELVRDCRAGRSSSWEELIRRYGRLIYSVCIRYGLSKEDAEEVFQQVSIKLFQSLGRLRCAGSLAVWLTVTTRRACQAHLRSRMHRVPLSKKVQEELKEEPPDLAEKLHRVACERTLVRALERLGEPCRGLLRALWAEEPRPSYQEIAARLGSPVGSLGPTRCRCLKKLRAIYAELGGEVPSFAGRSNGTKSRGAAAAALSPRRAS